MIDLKILKLSLNDYKNATRFQIISWNIITEEIIKYRKKVEAIPTI